MNVVFAPDVDVRLSGDPWALEQAARTLEATAAELRELERRVADAVPRSWTGLTAEAARVSGRGITEALRREAEALVPAVGALRRWADELTSAQQLLRTIGARAGEEQVRHERARRALLADPAPALPTPLLVDPRLAAEEMQHVQVMARLDRQAAAVRDDLDEQALACRRELEDTRSAVLRGHRESLDDYLRGVALELLRTVPVLARHEDTVAAALWGATTLPGLVVASGQAVRRANSLVKYLARGEAIRASRWTYAQSTMLRALGLRSWLEPTSTASRLWLGTAPTANLVTVGRTAAQAAGGGARGLLAGARAVGPAAGAYRFLGVGGSVVATGFSAANLAAQGNPVEAFRANGAEYVADVAEFGFNASTTAFFVAPTPWTAGAVAVTGAVWAGAELYAHRDDVVQIVKGAGPLVTDALDTARDTVDDVAEAGRRVVGDALTDARNVAAKLNPFD